MGMLIDGKWNDQDLRRANKNGEFNRLQASFRNQIGDDSFPAQPNRYHLFVNAGCPWAHRTILYHSVKQLSEVVSVSFTEAAIGTQGWTFGDQPEPILGALYMHDVYTKAEPDFSGRCTVPVLWDLQQNTIVNNESADIIRMFNSVFDGLPGVDSTNFYPAELAGEIDAHNNTIYPAINNGVYRCGFAQSQRAYDEAFDLLFSTLEKIDQNLNHQRFICGDVVTEADWRLFTTLVRFDVAYYGQFRCNQRRLTEFTNLWPYARDLYQQPRVARTVDFAAIKGIYYGSRPPHIIPKGPSIDFQAAHNRAALG